MAATVSSGIPVSDAKTVLSLFSVVILSIIGLPLSDSYLGRCFPSHLRFRWSISAPESARKSLLRTWIWNLPKMFRFLESVRFTFSEADGLWDSGNYYSKSAYNYIVPGCSWPCSSYTTTPTCIWPNAPNERIYNIYISQKIFYDEHFSLVECRCRIRTPHILCPCRPRTCWQYLHSTFSPEWFVEDNNCTGIKEFPAVSRAFMNHAEGHVWNMYCYKAMWTRPPHGFCYYGQQKSVR